MSEILIFDSEDPPFCKPPSLAGSGFLGSSFLVSFFGFGADFFLAAASSAFAIESAIAFACQKTNAQIRDFTVAPVFMESKERGAHEWLIEFVNGPSDSSHATKGVEGTPSFHLISLEENAFTCN